LKFGDHWLFFVSRSMLWKSINLFQSRVNEIIFWIMNLWKKTPCAYLIRKLNLLALFLWNNIKGSEPHKEEGRVSCHFLDYLSLQTEGSEPWIWMCTLGLNRAKHMSGFGLQVTQSARVVLLTWFTFHPCYL